MSLRTAALPSAVFLSVVAVTSAASADLAVSTFAGRQAKGFADGSRTAAMFNSPVAVAVDARGTLYVADGENHRIRRITPAGQVSTLAGKGTAGFADGEGPAAEFDSPAGVAVDARGNVYVADCLNHRIRKVSPQGLVSTIAGSGTAGYANGMAATAKFRRPTGVAIGNRGTLYIADSENNAIRKLTPDGRVTTLAGIGPFPKDESVSVGDYRNGVGTAARFDNPMAVAVDRAENVYVADESNCRIRKVTRHGLVSNLAGIATPAGEEADELNQFHWRHPVGGYADGVGSHAQFDSPMGIAVDARGTVYVADTWNHRIRRITPEGRVTTWAGNGLAALADGMATSASFNGPRGIAVDREGQVYVADTDNHCIRQLKRAAAPSRRSSSQVRGDVSARQVQ